MKKILFSALAASFLAAGCATEPQPVANAGAGPADEGEVLTGSRIPRKARVNAEGTKTITGQGYKTEQLGRGSADGVGPRNN
jgi:uncharacterized lipoprotein YajG